MSSQSVFVLGVTGYIGGAVAIALKKEYPDYKYITFTRSESSVPALTKLGFEPLVGSGNAEENLKLIGKASASADIVINCADADDLALTNTILDALKNSEKKNPILIHTSGTGVVSDKPNGEFQDTARKIWDDDKEEDIRAIAPSQPHREIDLAIFKASEEDKLITYIIAPSTIYGVAPENPVHKISQQIPVMIRTAIERRQTVYAGSGTNIWNNVHIHDLTSLYNIVFAKALKDRAAGGATSSPYTRFYWGSAASHVWGDVARALAPILYEKKVVDSPEAVSAPAKDLWPAISSNSQSVANRGFKDGWKPVHPSLWDTLKEDVDAVLQGEK